MQGNRFKNLFINTILFAIGQFGTTLLGILLVPLYTNYMTTDQYGTADLVTNLASMLLPVVTICITDGVIKFSLDGEHNVRKIFSVSFYTCLVGIVVSLAAYPLIYKYGKIPEYIVLFYLILSTNILNNLFLAYTKALRNLKLYTGLALLRTLTMLVSNIIMLTVLHAGVQGYLFSYVIANIVVISAAFVFNKLWQKISIKYVDKETSKEMVLFSLPLVPNNFSGWAMSSMDKYMLTYMMGASYNGLYTVAHKIPSVVSMFSSVFNQAWNYSALEEQKSKDHNEYYRTVFRIYSSYLFIIASAVLCVIKPIMLVWVGDKFKQAWMYSPYLLIAIIFSCFTGFYVPLFVMAEKTNHLFISTLIGAIVNGVLNMILIPLWGINGASLATVLTHFTVWTLRGIIIEKRTEVKLDKRKAYINSIFLMAQGTLLIFINQFWFIPQVICLLGVLVVNKNEIVAILHRVSHMIKKVKARK